MQNFIKTIISGLKVWTKKEIKKSSSQSDWSQNDPSGVGYIKNRPFYEDGETINTIDPKYLPEEVYDTLDELHSGLDEAFNGIDSVRTSAEAAQAAADNAKMDADTNAEKLMTSYIANTTLPSSTKTWTTPVYADGKFVVLGTSRTGTSNKAAYSLDGIKWVETELPEDQRWCSPMYGNGKFVAFASHASSTVAYSEDGINWNKTSVVRGDYSTHKYGGGVFVGMQTKSSVCVYSTDGVTWGQARLPVSGNLSQLLYVDGKFVVICTNTSGYSYALYSIDGMKWNKAGLPDYNLDGLKYSNGIFLAYRIASATDVAAYSFDGISWVKITLPVSMRWGDIVYANGIFAMNALGETSDAAYSFDGINWTQTTLPVSQYWGSLVYGNGVFVAFPYETSDAAYSFDGINWTQTTLPVSQTWNDLVYCNGVFIAFPYSTSDVAVYSLDGINWAKTTLPASQTWKDLVYDNGVFVAFPSSEGDSIAAYSFDGINWKTEYAAIIQNNADITIDIREILEIPTTEEITNLIDEKVGCGDKKLATEEYVDEKVAEVGSAATNEVVVSDVEPTDPNVVIWINPNEEDGGTGGGGVSSWNDLTDKPFYTETVEVLPETTVEIDPDMGMAMLPDLAIIADDECTIKYNGAEYVCVCADLGISLALGNFGMLDEETPVDTGEPFVIAKINDEDGNLIWVIMPLDGSSSVTLSIIGQAHHPVPDKYLPYKIVDVNVNVLFGVSDSYIVTADMDVEKVFQYAKTPNTIVRAIMSFDGSEEHCVLNLYKITNEAAIFNWFDFASTEITFNNGENTGFSTVVCEYRLTVPCYGHYSFQKFERYDTSFG